MCAKIGHNVLYYNWKISQKICDWFDRVDCPTVWFNRSGAFCSRYSFFLLLVVLQQKSINFVSRWNCTFRCREWLFEQIDNFRKSNSIAWGQFASSSVRPLRYYTNVVTLFMFQVIFNATKFTIFRFQVFCIEIKAWSYLYAGLELGIWNLLHRISSAGAS